MAGARAIALAACAIALTAASTAQAAYAQKGAHYGGLTSASGPVATTISGNGRAMKSAIYWRAVCSDHTAFLGTTVLKAGVRRSGHAGGSGRYAVPGGHVDFNVHLAFGASRLTGKFQATATHDTSDGPVKCKSPTFSLKAKRRNAFAGFRAGAPVMLQLNSKHSRVNVFGTVARMQCDDGHSEPQPVLARKLKVRKSTGRFKGTSKLSGKTPNGNHYLFTATVAGKVHGAKAAGTFKQTLVYRKPGGAILATCTAHGSWSARRG